MLLIKYLESSSVRIGDLSADAFQLSQGSEVWDDLRVSAGNAKLAGTRDPAFQQFRDDGSGSTGVYALMFTYEAIENNQKEIFFEIQMPHTWAEGTPVIPHVHFSPTTTDTGTVRWGLEYTVASVGETFPTTTTVYAERTIDSADQYGHRIPASFGELDFSDHLISAVMMGRIFRNSNHANDDLNAAVAFISFDLHIQVNTLGSELEYIKFD
jgi:hypothetical protein